MSCGTFARDHSCQRQNPHLLAYQLAYARGAKFGVKSSQTMWLEDGIDLRAIAQFIKCLPQDGAPCAAGQCSTISRIAAWVARPRSRNRWSSAALFTFKTLSAFTPHARFAQSCHVRVGIAELKGVLGLASEAESGEGEDARPPDRTALTHRSPEIRRIRIGDAIAAVSR